MLKEKIEELAKLRVEFEGRENDYKQKKAEFESSLTYKYYKSCGEDIEKLETEIRQEAEANFKATGEKQPHPAVEIREITELSYETKPALEYVKVKLPQALSLDKKIFEKVIKVLPEEEIPWFVKIEQTPKAYIQKDLTEFLKEE